MQWIVAHKNLWRGIIFLLVLVTLFGPWLFESLYVPDRECEPPSFRVREDFCGWPMTGNTMATWMGLGFFSIAASMLSGARAFSDNPRELLSLLFLLPVVPLFGLLFLILLPSRRNLTQIVLWGLALGACVFIINEGRIAPPRAVWGVWLYVAVAAAALVLEIAVWLAGRRQALELAQ